MRMRALAFLGVLIAAVGMVFVPSSAALAVTQTPISNAQYPVGLAEDSSGNIYIADENNKLLKVVAATTGTLFGVSITAGAQSTILNDASSFARGVAVNPQGDLFFSTSDSKLKVITRSNKTIFGVSAIANTPTVVANTWSAGGLDFDSNGNLFGVGVATNVLEVLPVASGTLFGTSVTANVRSALSTRAGAWFWDLAVDASGNILIADGWSGAPGVYILTGTSGSLYGQAVTANTLTRLTTFGSNRRAGIDVDGSGNLFVVTYGGYVEVYSPSGQDMFGQAVNPNTLTVISDTATSNITDQGMLVASNGDVITGGGDATYRTVNYLPAPPAKTVTFDANGGTGTMGNQISSAAAHLDGNVFARSGFTFSGWNSATDGTGAAYQDFANYSFNSDITLYAQWVPVVGTSSSATLASTGISDGMGWLLALVSLLSGLTLVRYRRTLLRR